MKKNEILEVLRAESETLVLAYNEAVQGGNFTEAMKVDTQLVEKVNEYTATARTICFEECKASSENPAEIMMYAVKTLVFSTIACKDEKRGDEKIPVRSIIEKEKPIDLSKLHKFCGAIGADANWDHILQKMNLVFTLQKCQDLGVDPKSVNDSYSMSELARSVDMGKNPTSNTQILKTLQMVVSAMIGEEYKCTSHDVKFLKSIYSKKGKKALSVAVSNHRYLRQYMAEICHKIVLEKSYTVEFKAKDS